MRNLLRAALTLVCLRFFFGAPIFLSQSPNHVCSVADCVTYGGPNDTYSVPVAYSQHEIPSSGWIVGEIRAFAFGADNSNLVRSFGGNGWVECAGQLIDRSDFPEAVALLQDTWGSQSASKSQVYLPDLRGLVLRGWHHGRRAPERYPFSPYTGDGDLGSRVFPRPDLLDLPEPGIAGPTDIKTKQVIKDHVGSMQSEQFHGHRHSFSFIAGSGTVPVRKDETSAVNSTAELVRIGSSTGFSGGNETHPPNVFVLYLIYLGRPSYEPPESEEDKRIGRPRRIQGLKD